MPPPVSLNLAEQLDVIAVMAHGYTMVGVTSCIDASVQPNDLASPFKNGATRVSCLRCQPQIVATIQVLVKNHAKGPADFRTHLLPCWPCARLCCHWTSRNGRHPGSSRVACPLRHPACHLESQ